MMSVSTEIKNNKLPWWTWVAPFFIFQIGSLISLQFRYDTGVGAFYLPSAFAIVMVNWWGPKRVIPALYISSTILTPFWGVEVWWQWPIYPICESLYVWASWFVFTQVLKGKYWLPNTSELAKFIFLGIFIPLVLELTLLQVLLTIFGEQPKELFISHIARNWLGEFTATFGISVLVLFIMTPYMSHKNLLCKKSDHSPSIKNLTSGNQKFEILGLYALIFILSIVIPFDTYWYFYSAVALYIALRFGFKEVIICNFLIFLFTYILPNYYSKLDPLGFYRVDILLNVFLGNITLYVFAAFTGRVVSDLNEAEEKINRQLTELEQTNKELDRFVYSVSHDLSAPLKSIQGLVNISQLDHSDEFKSEYLKKIGQSVSKLDLFIKEILDYSRNKRLTVEKESIQLKEMCEEIIENLKYIENYPSVKFDLSATEKKIIRTDKLRLKIILTNLFSNAIKFQKQKPTELAMVEVRFTQNSIHQLIIVNDNGEGIKSEYVEKIFNMFFRAHQGSSGSGLGLYIAKEAAEKLGGTLMVASEYGKGSTFTLQLPLND